MISLPQYNYFSVKSYIKSSCVLISQSGGVSIEMEYILSSNKLFN